MLDWPDPPDVPEAQRSRGEVPLRYEDVSQDGRLTLNALPQGIGRVFWHNLAVSSGVDAEIRERGILPILTRLVTCGGEGPLSVLVPLSGRGRFRLASASGEDGEIERLFLDVWVELEGPRGHLHAATPGAGETIDAGRVYAEHTFTRPFAPAGERKVTALPAVQLPVAARGHQPPSALLALPEGAHPLDALHLQDEPVVVGLDHTDSNQHVNSLVYPRWIREAALARLAQHGRATRLLARYQDTAFRKPVFAGERLRMALRCFELDGAVGAVAALIDASDLEAVHRGRAFGVVVFGE
jgi:acyl-CoA thioesterase FadM